MKNKERKKENETSLRSPLRAPIWSRVHPRSSLSTPPPDLMERRLDKLRRNKDVSSCRWGSSSSIFTIPNHTHTRTIIEKRKTTTIIQLNLFGLQRSKELRSFAYMILKKTQQIIGKIDKQRENERRRREKRISESDWLCNKVQRDSSQDPRHEDSGRLRRRSRTRTALILRF